MSPNLINKAAAMVSPGLPSFGKQDFKEDNDRPMGFGGGTL